MNAPHPHAEQIKAWADGEEVQVYSPLSFAWVDLPLPGGQSIACFSPLAKFRRKPDPYQHLKDAVAAGKWVQLNIAGTWLGSSQTDWEWTYPPENYRIVEVDEISHHLRDNDTGKVTDLTLVIEHVFGEVINARVKEFS